MPGILGIIDTALIGSSELPVEMVVSARAMLQAMRLEPSYSARLVNIPSLGSCLGQVEIAALGPLDESVIALLTGERAPKSLARGSVDDIIAAVQGGCAGAVADRNDKRVVVFNDRYGRERLFVHTEGTRTYFASEAKAILAACPSTRAFDAQGLAEYFACGCTLTARSLFKDVEVLEAGTALTFRSGGLERQRYVTERELEGQETLSSTAFREAVVESLRSEVRAAAAATPPTALSLTGGLDSRMVAACLAKEAPIQTFTFGSMYRTTGDVAVARSVARACGLSHQVIELGRDFLESFRPCFERSVFISDGYLGLSGAAELHVNEKARAIAPARMTGNWGGEMMRGVRAFKFSVPKGGFLRPGLLKGIADSEAAFSPRIADPLSGTLFHQMPLQGYGRYAIERSQVTTRTPFLAPPVVDALYRARPEVRASNETAAAVIGQQPSLLPLATDAGVNVVRPSRLHRQWRRAIIKAEYSTSHGAPDWMARLAATLPPALLEKRFLGVDKFYHFRHWMRHDFAPVVRDLVDDAPAQLEEWIDVPRIKTMAAQHLRGEANYTDSLDKVMALVMAQRQLLDDAAWRRRQQSDADGRDWEECTL